MYFFQRKLAIPIATNRLGSMVRRLHEDGRVAQRLEGSPGMLNWALIFFIIAVVAAVFGFSGIAIASAGVAKILFFLFLILFVVSLLSGLIRRV